MVQENNLSSNVVTIQHDVDLFKISQEMELKLTPRLSASILKPNHFEKMKVGLAVSLINNAISVALESTIQHKKLSSDVLTTAWFFRELHQWYTMTTSRHVSTYLRTDDNSHTAETKISKYQ